VTNSLKFFKMKNFRVLALTSLLFSLSFATYVGRELTENNFDLTALKEHINSLNVRMKFVEFGEPGNANVYMDQVMELLREEILVEGLNNVALPDGNIGFNMSFWPFGRVFGGVRLYNGFLKGIETISRVGDATLTVHDQILTFESLLGINDASLGYSLSVTFLDIGPRGSMSGDMQYAHLYFKATLDILSKTIHIDKLDVREIGHISTDVKGLGIFNWLAEKICDVAINLAKGVFTKVIEGPIKAILNKILDSLIPHFPHFSI